MKEKNRAHLFSIRFPDDRMLILTKQELSRALRRGATVLRNRRLKNRSALNLSDSDVVEQWRVTHG